MHKFESDMTVREKRHQEIEKLKKMSFKEKVSHMWAYHKLILFMPVIILVLVVSVFRWIENSRYETVLHIAISDSAWIDTDEVAKEIKTLLNIDNRFSVIGLDNTYFTRDGELTMESVQKFAVVVANRRMDIFITGEDLFDLYMPQEIFMNLHDLFTSEELAEMELLDGYGIYVGDSDFIRNQLDIIYSPVFLGVISNVDLEEVNQDGGFKKDLIRDFYFDVIRKN